MGQLLPSQKFFIAMKNHLNYYLMNIFALLIIVLILTTCKEKCETSPGVTTDPASFITQSGATLNGTIYTEGQKTTATFECGTTTDYDHTIYITLPFFGLSCQDIHASISGLSPGSTYHYRIKATGLCQSTNGRDLSFTTFNSGESGIIPIDYR